MRDSKTSRKIWNQIYEKKGQSYHSPPEPLKKITSNMSDLKSKKVLDVGCGTGTHLKELAAGGMRTYGVDISPTAIKLTKTQVRGADLKCLDIFSDPLPYPKGFFDLIVSLRVLNHSTIEGIRKALGELSRVLKGVGLIIASVRKRIPKSKRHPAEFLDSHTYIPTGGEEAGVTHYFFSKKSLANEFGKHFKVIEVETDSNDYYIITAKSL